MLKPKSIFITQRALLIGWGVVVVLVLGWIWSPLFVIAQLALLALVLAISAELVLLYGKSTGIRGSRQTLERWSNGDENPVSILLHSDHATQVRVRVLDELPVQFQERGLAFKGHMDAAGSCSFTYRVRPLQRGLYSYGAMNVFVSLRTGLLERRYQLEAAREVPVFPSYLQLRKYELMAISDRLTLAGIKRIRRVAHQSEFERIKDYVPGDDRRSVNWKATARRGKMMVNQYQDERAQQVFALIDTGRVMKMPFNGLSLLDHAINAALVIGSIAMRKEDRFGLVTFSNVVHDTLPASRQRNHMQAVLQALYAQGTDHKETDMEALFTHVRRDIRQRSLLLLFTNFESVSAMRRQLPYMLRLSRQHLVVPIFFRNSELDVDLTKEPEDTEQLYIRTIVDRMLHEKRQIALELERHGMPTILCRPEDLSVQVIDKYLEIKARGML
jgi:uncharacterized protein (DUF58 family)